MTEKEKKIRLIQDYNKVFSTEEGKNVLMDMMERSYLLSKTDGDQLKEGRRELILEVLFNLSYDVTALLTMIEDSNKEKREKKNEQSSEDFDFFKD